jgi:hypothetical protein
MAVIRGEGVDGVDLIRMERKPAAPLSKLTMPYPREPMDQVIGRFVTEMNALIDALNARAGAGR